MPSEATFKFVSQQQPTNMEKTATTLLSGTRQIDSALKHMQQAQTVVYDEGPPSSQNSATQRLQLNRLQQQ